MLVMYDVVALGELLIDLTPYGYSEQGQVVYEGNPGGAPANVLVALAKMGKKTAFIGKVGQDQFGKKLEQTLKSNDVDTKGLVFTDKVPTTLTCVELNEEGDRAFLFYRNPGADVTLEAHEVDFELIAQARVFHFGTVSLTNEPSRSATFKAVQYAKHNQILISYDPNLRENLWDSLEDARANMEEGLKYADILKLSEEELVFVTGIADLEQASRSIAQRYGTPLIFVTLGDKGCLYCMGNEFGYEPAYDVQAVDTTGAGDAFLAAILYQLLEKGGIAGLQPEYIRESVRFACAAGALTTTQKGAIPAMPLLSEIENCMRVIKQKVTFGE
jgi:fructokinase